MLLIRELFAETGNVRVSHVFPDGASALEHLQAQASDPAGRLPALVILDINMPRRNGFEVLAAMKADPRLRHVPVVLLTSSRREQDIVKAYALGACSYIPKPVGIERFASLTRLFAAYWSGVVSLPPTNPGQGPRR